ncbi:hypothetical protein Tco_0796915 [Tanacetum coccineum]
MDHYTKKALWIYWIRGDDEVELTDKEFSNNDDEVARRNDGFCNGENLPQAYIFRNLLHYQDYEWYEALEDDKLKEEALRNKAIMEGFVNEEDDDESHEEYDAIKEDEYDDLARTNDDACRAYQEIFRMIDEGWMVTELSERRS